MKKIFLMTTLMTTPAFADHANLPHVASCIEQDWLSIEDDGSEKAIVTYSNSIESCSPPVSILITAPNGISVHVKIVIGDSERIILTPQNPNFMSFPPEGDVTDGEVAKFTIMGGLS